MQEVAALQGTAQGKRHCSAEEAAAHLAGAEAELEHALKQWPVDGVRPVKLYRGGSHSRAEAGNDNGTSVVGSNPGLAAALPGADSFPPPAAWSSFAWIQSAPTRSLRLGLPCG